MKPDLNSVTGVQGVLLQNVLPKRDRMWWNYPALRTLNLLLLCAIVCDVTNGYDGSMLNGLQIIPAWAKYFDTPTGVKLGVINNGVRIGQIASLPFVAPLQERLGRRMPIAIGSIILLIGVVLQAASQNLAMFVVGRVFIGFGNNIQACTCPVLIAELCYPSQRPTIIGIMNSTGSIGSIMAAWITYGTAFMGASSWSWRLPSALQAMSSLFQLSLIFFAPESPRWLVHNNRTEEATQILIKYHAEGDVDSELVRFEMAAIENAIEMEKVQSSSSWLQWIRTPANRYRLFIIITLGFMIQWCGNALISYYLHLVLNSIGITDTKTQLLLNGGLNLNGLFFGVLFSIFIDRIGRRPLFLGGMAGMFVAYFIFTILTGINESHNFSNAAMGSATVAMIFIFGAFYKMPGPVVDSYIGEISPFELRAKGFVIKQACDAGANLFSGFVNPIALVAIQWKYYIVWCCMLISNFIIVYFFYPETKFLSLEEVTQMFDGSYEQKLVDEEKPAASDAQVEFTNAAPMMKVG